MTTASSPTCRLRPATALALALTIGTAGCAGPGPNRVPEATDPTGRIVLTVDGFESDEGQALINLFLGPDGFPGDPVKAWSAIERAIEGGRVQVTLEDVPAGSLALSVFHDADGDFELDENLLGIPTEAWGASNGARSLMGPPDYADAELTLEAGATLEATITVD
jgi:uncharacterized protein (DUF2141 family)